MKKAIWIISCVLGLAVVGVAILGYCRWHSQKYEIKAQLEEQLRDMGITSTVDIRKSKLDGNDLKLKIWFNVPDDRRIIDVFWSDGAFRYMVFQNGAPESLTREELQEFLRQNDDSGIR